MNQSDLSWRNKTARFNNSQYDRNMKEMSRQDDNQNEVVNKTTTHEAEILYHQLYHAGNVSENSTSTHLNQHQRKPNVVNMVLYGLLFSQLRSGSVLQITNVENAPIHPINTENSATAVNSPVIQSEEIPQGVMNSEGTSSYLTGLVNTVTDAVDLLVANDPLKFPQADASPIHVETALRNNVKWDENNQVYKIEDESAKSAVIKLIKEFLISSEQLTAGEAEEFETNMQIAAAGKPIFFAPTSPPSEESTGRHKRISVAAQNEGIRQHIKENCAYETEIINKDGNYQGSALLFWAQQVENPFRLIYSNSNHIPTHHQQHAVGGLNMLAGVFTLGFLPAVGGTVAAGLRYQHYKNKDDWVCSTRQVHLAVANLGNFVNVQGLKSPAKGRVTPFVKPKELKEVKAVTSHAPFAARNPQSGVTEEIFLKATNKENPDEIHYLQPKGEKEYVAVDRKSGKEETPEHVITVDEQTQVWRESGENPVEFNFSLEGGKTYIDLYGEKQEVYLTENQEYALIVDNEDGEKKPITVYMQPISKTWHLTVYNGESVFASSPHDYIKNYKVPVSKDYVYLELPNDQTTVFGDGKIYRVALATDPNSVLYTVVEMEGDLYPVKEIVTEGHSVHYEIYKLNKEDDPDYPIIKKYPDCPIEFANESWRLEQATAPQIGQDVKNSITPDMYVSGITSKALSAPDIQGFRTDADSNVYFKVDRNYVRAIKRDNYAFIHRDENNVIPLKFTDNQFTNQFSSSELAKVKYTLRSDIPVIENAPFTSAEINIIEHISLSPDEKVLVENINLSESGPRYLLKRNTQGSIATEYICINDRFLPYRIDDRTGIAEVYNREFPNEPGYPVNYGEEYGWEFGSKTKINSVSAPLFNKLPKNLYEKGLDTRKLSPLDSRNVARAPDGQEYLLIGDNYIKLIPHEFLPRYRLGNAGAYSPVCKFDAEQNRFVLPGEGQRLVKFKQRVPQEDTPDPSDDESVMEASDIESTMSESEEVEEPDMGSSLSSGSGRGTPDDEMFKQYVLSTVERAALNFPHGLDLDVNVEAEELPEELISVQPEAPTGVERQILKDYELVVHCEGPGQPCVNYMIPNRPATDFGPIRLSDELTELEADTMIHDGLKHWLGENNVEEFTLEQIRAVGTPEELQKVLALVANYNELGRMISSLEEAFQKPGFVQMLERRLGELLQTDDPIIIDKAKKYIQLTLHDANEFIANHKGVEPNNLFFYRSKDQANVPDLDKALQRKAFVVAGDPLGRIYFNLEAEEASHVGLINDLTVLEGVIQQPIKTHTILTQLHELTHHIVGTGDYMYVKESVGKTLEYVSAEEAMNAFEDQLLKGELGPEVYLDTIGKQPQLRGTKGKRILTEQDKKLAIGILKQDPIRQKNMQLNNADNLAIILMDLYSVITAGPRVKRSNSEDSSKIGLLSFALSLLNVPTYR